MRRYIHKVIGVAVIGAINAYQLGAAEHTIWAIGFGLLAPAIGISEYVRAKKAEPPDPTCTVSHSERLLGWVIVSQVACMVAW